MPASTDDDDVLTYKKICDALDFLEQEARRPYHFVYVGPPYEGETPPPDWPGWYCIQKEYDE